MSSWRNSVSSSRNRTPCWRGATVTWSSYRPLRCQRVRPPIRLVIACRACRNHLDIAPIGVRRADPLLHAACACLCVEREDELGPIGRPACVEGGEGGRRATRL